MNTKSHMMVQSFTRASFESMDCIITHAWAHVINLHDKLSEVLLRSTKNGVAFVLFRYQKKPGSHSQKCHTGTLSTTTDDTLSTPRGLCSDSQQETPQPEGETQGTCALDFAGGSAPRTPGGAQGVAQARLHLTLQGAPPPAPPAVCKGWRRRVCT